MIRYRVRRMLQARSLNLESSEHEAVISNTAQVLNFNEFGDFKSYTDANNTLGECTCMLMS